MAPGNRCRLCGEPVGPSEGWLHGATLLCDTCHRDEPVCPGCGDELTYGGDYCATCSAGADEAWRAENHRITTPA